VPDRALLATYLNDHLAGATAALELARRARGSNRETPLGEALDRLAHDIDADRAELRRLMERLGVGADHVKVAAGWLAEKAGRLKPNGRLLSYSPLSRVIELEALALGVEGKLRLWRTLRRLRLPPEVIDGERLSELVARAQAQLRELERHRLRAVDEALAAER
jgi:hypothetical protein